MKTKKEGKRIYPIHPVSCVLLALGAIGGAVYTLCLFSSSFADFINTTIGAFIRFILAQISALLPISIMEFLLFSAPLIAVCIIYVAVKSGKKGKIYLIRTLSAVLSIAATVYFLFSVSFAPGYRTTPFHEKAGLDRRDVTATELYETTIAVLEELNPISERITRLKDGSSASPMSYDELSAELSRSYEKLSEKYTFIKTFDSRIKPLVISPLMTYTHLSGIYSFFTGEANVNTNYPDFVNVFTAAHEMAHQRGVAREDEANFTAFLVMMESDCDYIRYSALLNMYQYLSSALYSADRDLWSEAREKISPAVSYELSAYSLFFEKYRDSTASKVADSVNNAYLESQGTKGSESYGLVVDLAVSYYITDKQE